MQQDIVEMDEDESISREFVNLFYQALETIPEDIHKFYSSTARCSLRSPQSSSTVIGGEKISAQLKEHGLFGSTLAQKPCNMTCQRTSANELVIMVSGSLLIPNSKAIKPFAQVFILVSEDESVMYVYNDILHLFDAVATDGLTKLVAPSVVEPQISSSAASEAPAVVETVKQSIIDPEVAKIQNTQTSPAPTTTSTTTTPATVVENPQKEEEHTAPVLAPKVVSNNNSKSQQQAPATTTHANNGRGNGSQNRAKKDNPGVPGSYASMVTKNAVPSSPSRANQKQKDDSNDTTTTTSEDAHTQSSNTNLPSSNNTSTSATTSAVATTTTTTTTPSIATTSTGSSSAASSSKQDKSNNTTSEKALSAGNVSKNLTEKSIFVKDIPSNVESETTISEAFSRFGQVVHVDFKKAKNSAYVEFVDSVGVKAALSKQAGPVTLGGKVVTILERRTGKTEKQVTTTSSTSGVATDSSSNNHKSNSNSQLSSQKVDGKQQQQQQQRSRGNGSGRTSGGGDGGNSGKKSNGNQAAAVVVAAAAATTTTTTTTTTTSSTSKDMNGSAVNQTKGKSQLQQKQASAGNSNNSGSGRPRGGGNGRQSREGGNTSANTGATSSTTRQ